MDPSFFLLVDPSEKDASSFKVEILQAEIVLNKINLSESGCRAVNATLAKQHLLAYNFINFQVRHLVSYPNTSPSESLLAAFFRWIHSAFSLAKIIFVPAPVHSLLGPFEPMYFSCWKLELCQIAA